MRENAGRRDGVRRRIRTQEGVTSRKPAYVRVRLRTRSRMHTCTYVHKDTKKEPGSNQLPGPSQEAELTP